MRKVEENMRLFVIGRILDESSRRIVAYKVYDAISKTVGVYDKDIIHERVKQGVVITGLFVKSDGIVSGLHGSFSLSKTELLNGKGLPIKDSGRYTLVAISGYAENEHFRLATIRGLEKIVNLAEFKELVDKNLVNGAVKSDRKKNNLVLYKYCNVREFWIKEENNSNN